VLFNQFLCFHISVECENSNDGNTLYTSATLATHAVDILFPNQVCTAKARAKVDVTNISVTYSKYSDLMSFVTRKFANLLLLIATLFLKLSFITRAKIAYKFLL